MGNYIGIFDFLGEATTKENEFQAEAQKLQDLERQKYAQKILQAQTAADDTQYRQMLNNQMQGIGPSVADATQRKYAQDATQNAMAFSNSARGDVNPALLQRNAQKMAMQAQAQGAQNAGIMKNQESLNAAQLFGQNRAQNLGQQQFYEQLGMQGDMANMGSANQAQGINASTAAGNTAAVNTATGSALNGIASGAMMLSDENEKTDIHSGASEIQSFLDALKAHKYKYKNPANGEGEFVSPMAQELEKSSVGDSMVEDTPSGKMVNYGKGFGAVLAAQAHLNERLKKLEKKNG